mgnify:FL=1
MARGWESKSVDDQIAAVEAAREERQKAELSGEQQSRAAARETLMLNRSRTLQSLQTACDRRHRALLEDTLAHLDRELKSLETH